MMIRPYFSSDYPKLSEWLLARNTERWESEYLPKIGYVVTEDEKPVVMGFLRFVEGDAGMIDALCSNPEFPGPVRDEAINLLVNRLLSTAKAMGMRGIMCFTKDKNTLERSERFGFEKRQDQTIIALKLGA